MKFLKYLSIVFVSLFALGFLALQLVNEPLPNGQISDDADDMARKMMLAINDSAWQQTGAVSWGYRGHQHIWDRSRHYDHVVFGDYTVIIDINNRRGLILQGGEGLNPEEKQAVCLKAWKYWANDSFWLNPISKVFDPGTERRLVKLENGENGLLITYTSGGATPGDSYLWMLDESGLPNAWKFWVSIIPIKGLKLTWENWVELETGVLVATVHNGISTIFLENPVGKSELLELTNREDIFEALEMDISRLTSF